MTERSRDLLCSNHGGLREVLPVTCTPALQLLRVASWSLHSSNTPSLLLTVLRTRRNILEQMLPELEELQERGYFSKPEIKAVLRKRTYFEYLMKRKAVLKADIHRSSSPYCKIYATWDCTAASPWAP